MGLPHECVGLCWGRRIGRRIPGRILAKKGLKREKQRGKNGRGRGRCMHTLITQPRSRGQDSRNGVGLVKHTDLDSIGALSALHVTLLLVTRTLKCWRKRRWE